jgi:hypothetical protein
MQLTVDVIDWNRLDSLQFDQSTDKVIMSACEELQVGRPPWPSDSTLQVFELSECYEAIKNTIAVSTKTHADKIMNTLVHKSFMFPWELNSCPRGECFVGAISPSTVREYVNTFSQISYTELDEAFDSRMPTATRNEFEIARYPSEDVFTGYLRQWEEMFKYAVERDAGVLLHCG